MQSYFPQTFYNTEEHRHVAHTDANLGVQAQCERPYFACLNPTFSVMPHGLLETFSKCFISVMVLDLFYN